MVDEVDPATKPAPRIVGYAAVCAGNTSDLVRKVGKKITEGWQPWGGICIDASPGGDFYQAMVKFG